MVAILPPLIAGAATATGGFAASKLLGGLFGGGGSKSSSGGGGGGGGMSNQQMKLMEEMFGFENDATRFLDTGGEYFYFDAEDDYNDSLRSQNYFDNVYDAVQNNDLDYFQASQMLQSAFRNNSEFYSGKDFQNFLSAEVGKRTTNNIIQDAFSTNLMRPGTDAEVARLRGWLDATGQNKSPMQIASAVNRNLMGSLEGEKKAPYSSYEKASAARYGGFGRDSEGNKTYLVNPYRRGGSASPTMSYDQQYGVA